MNGHWARSKVRTLSTRGRSLALLALGTIMACAAWSSTTSASTLDVNGFNASPGAVDGDVDLICSGPTADFGDKDKLKKLRHAAHPSQKAIDKARDKVAKDKKKVRAAC